METKQTPTEELNNEQLMVYADVAGTPFTLAKQTLENGEKRYHALMGNHRVHSEEVYFKNEEEAKEFCTQLRWDTILQVIAILILNQEKLKTKTK